MKKLLILLAIAIAGFLAYAIFWPSSFSPVGWQAPDANALSGGPFARQQPVVALTRLAVGQAVGPETVAVDRQGRLYVGYADGTIRRFRPDGQGGEVFATTNGRPLGMVFGPPLPAARADADTAVNNGNVPPTSPAGGRRATAQPAAGPPPQTLYVADAEKGLLAIAPNGRITSLATGVDGQDFALTDGIDVAGDGTLYFTDASSKYDLDHYRDAILEHGGHGRLMRYDPATGQVHMLMHGLQFANGVAVGPDARYVLVTETGSYRVMRYWLKGPKAGHSEVFVDNLPGFPDGISFDGKHHFWLALFAPRNALLDFTSGLPWLRRIVYHLPRLLQPEPERCTHVVGLDTDGRVIANVVDRSDNAFAPVTSVVQSGQQLYLGSLSAPAFARMPLPDTRP